MHKITACLGASLLSLLALSGVAEQTIEYQYDELGRLTFVSDNVNGNRDYDYDPAGNRTSVSLNGDDTVTPVPDKPVGLSCNGPISQSGGYVASWSAAAKATYYIYEDWSGTEYQTSGTTLTKQQDCYFVMACNDVGCSDKAKF